MTSRRIAAHLKRNVYGLVAIFIALGGTAVAATVAKNSVTSKSIQNNAIKGKDVRNEALTADDIDESTLNGIEGPQGPQGPPGPATGGAGGALTGTYPNPGLAANSVGAAEVAANSIGRDELNEPDLNLIVDGDCMPGIARGVVEIAGATVGATFGTAGVDNDNAKLCTGSNVEARRNSVGSYCVRFNNLNHAFSTPFVSLGVGAAAEANISAGNGGACPAESYEVLVSNSGGTLTDANFAVLAL
jgi:hypothetical protein